VRTAEQLANDTLRLCCVHPERVPPDVVAAHTAMTIARGHYPGLEQEFADAARSVVRTISRRSQFAAMAASVSAPVLLLHGRDDRLVRVTGARMLARRQSGWRYAEAPFVGHVPQLEVPAWTAEQLQRWLPEVPASGPAGPSTGTNPQLSGLV
jgi:pimeloyl-ACP methyl ester carboxylesterase